MHTFSALCVGTLLATAAHAQQQYGPNNAPRIDGFNVDEVRRLDPGAELNFDVYGTPGGSATLRIAGATRNLVLYETEPGQYEGTYTISSRDRISAQSAVTANLRVGDRVVSAVLPESLQTGVGPHPYNPGAPNAPKIGQFDVTPAYNLNVGSELSFRLSGTPGGRAELSIAGARGKFFLPEVRTGQYAGSYVVKSRDRVAPNSVVTATLRVGDKVSVVTLGKALVYANAPAQPVVRAAPPCGNCGNIEAVRPVEVTGEGNYLGTIGGGVVGALLGSQVGGGSGRTAAQIAGAIGGAYAGREIERNTNKTVHYEVVVRMTRGGTQVLTVPNDPQVRIGDKVRVDNGALLRDW